MLREFELGESEGYRGEIFKIYQRGSGRRFKEEFAMKFRVKPVPTGKQYLGILKIKLENYVLISLWKASRIKNWGKFAEEMSERLAEEGVGVVQGFKGEDIPFGGCIGRERFGSILTSLQIKYSLKKK